MACKYLTSGENGRRRSITSLAGDAPVAGRAIPTGRMTKAHKRLSARIADYERGGESKDAGPKKRWSSGGYHRPGSLQR